MVNQTVPAKAGRIIAIGGGKGGAGKSIFTTNTAVALAQSGKRVVLVDADLGGANVHTILGVTPPLVTLSDFIGRRASLEDVAIQTPVPNLRFVSGALDDVQAANPNYQQKMRLLRHIASMECDVLMLDLGAGTGFNTVDFFLLADAGVLVVLPEPTSIENAYRFLKAAFLRRLRAIQRAFAIKDLIDVAMRNRNALGIHTPADILRIIDERDRELGAAVREQMAGFSPQLVVNQAIVDGVTDDRQVAEDMASACRRFFGIHLRVLGTLPPDDAVKRAVRARHPFVLAEPSAPVSVALTQMSRRLMLDVTRTERAA